MIDEMIAFFEIPLALALRFRRTTAVLGLITAFGMGVCGVHSNTTLYRAGPGTVAMAPDPPAAAPNGAYSFDQLRNALQGTGMDAGKATVGAAIAEAESSGQKDAWCQNCAGVFEQSVGPWQINLNAHPDVSIECAESLNCAAAAAARISSGGTNWSSWSTYKSGAYRAYLGMA